MVHGVLELGEAALERTPRRSRPSGTEISIRTPVSWSYSRWAESNTVAQPSTMTEPQAVVQALHRLGLADVDIIVLSRGYAVRNFAILAKRRVRLSVS